MNNIVNPVHAPSWLNDDAPDRDVVISSRVRFARNSEDYPFNRKASDRQKQQLREDLYDAVQSLDSIQNLEFVRIEDCDDPWKRLFVERRLISEELTHRPYSGFFLDSDEKASIMVNEEDHVRIQSFRSGNQITDCFEHARKIERELDRRISYAFDEQWGFLTSCPTNLGTGLRASVLLHLPGLVMTRKIDRVLKAISNLGLTVRGFEGEDSESRGFLFQLSNQVTLGQSAEDMRNNLDRVCGQVVKQERNARNSLRSTSRVDVEDQIWRSVGILRYAQKLDTTEAIETLSYCRLGVDRGLVEEIGLEAIDGLYVLIQPAHISLISGGELQSEERDYHRAKMVRSKVSAKDPTSSDKDEDVDSSQSNSRSREP